jgi:hypothetical protein
MGGKHFVNFVKIWSSMTSVTLKNARRLESVIEQKISQFIGTEGRVLMNRSVSVHEDFNRVLNETAPDVLAKTKSVFELIAVRYAIRAAIATANQKSGVVDLMVRDQMLKDSIRLIDEMGFSGVTDAEQREVYKSRLNMLKNAVLTGTAPANHYGPSDAITLSNLSTEEVSAEAAQIVRAFQKNRSTIADECSRINLSTTIALTDEQVATLQMFDIEL